LAKYIFAEAPDDWPPDLTPKEKKEIEAAVHMTPQAMPHRVGLLYQLMIDLLSDGHALPDSVFRVETVPFQASWDEWGRGYNGVQRGASPQSPSPNVIVQRLASRTDAVSALNQIARQGEWPEEDPKAQELSHFRRFLKIFRAFPQSSARWSPTWAVPTNPQAPGEAASGAGPIIQHPEAALWSLVFNIRYRMLLAYLAHSFRLSAEPMETGAASPRGMVINRTFAEMYNLRSTASILVQLPLTDEKNAKRAGPPFQIPYTTKLPSEEADCWRVHVDLIDAAGRLLEELSKASKTKRADYAVALRNADRQARRELEILIGSSRRNQESMPQRRSIAL
jgi:Ferritin-like